MRTEKEDWDAELRGEKSQPVWMLPGLMLVVVLGAIAIAKILWGN